MGLKKASVFLSLIASAAQAQTIQQQPAAVNSGAGNSAGFQAVVLSGQASRTGQQGLTINITNTCFGTNLRNVSNPLAPHAEITATMTFLHQGSEKTATVKYLGSAVIESSDDIPAAISSDKLTGGATATRAGNSVRVIVPVNYTSTVDEEGNITESFDGVMTGISFRQDFPYAPPSGSEYTGTAGALSASVSKSVSKDGKQYSVSAHFPGQSGFCGGYFSPLMVFFDEARPKFDAHVSFPLNPSGKTMWPEKGSKGAFIAFDRDGDGKIAKADELFGNTQEAHKNGFEALREFDSNQDGVIDAKDKDFAKLLLWFDKNGNGVSEKGELVPLSSRIQSISLRYDDKAVEPFGTRAEAREKSTFIFVHKGKEKTGTVIDFWFAPKP